MTYNLNQPSRNPAARRQYYKTYMNRKRARDRYLGLLKQPRFNTPGVGCVEILLPGTFAWYRCTHDEYEKYILDYPSGTRVKISGGEEFAL